MSRTRILTTTLQKEKIQIEVTEIPRNKIETTSEANVWNGAYDLYLCAEESCYHATVPKGSLSMAKLFQAFSAQVEQRRSEKITFYDEEGKAYRLLQMDNGAELSTEKKRQLEELEAMMK